MRRPCVQLALLVFSVLALASCSVDDLLKKAENRTSETTVKTKASASPNQSAAAVGQPSLKPNAATVAFKGDIAGKAGKEKLYEFLQENDKKVVRLDLLLSDEQLAEINDVDKGNRWYFDLAYPDKDGFNTGGELLIDISKGKSGLRLDGNHLTGQIKVIGWAGPHQGLMSINAKPVTEAAETKPTTEGKAAPIPSAKSQAATRPRSAM